MKEKLADFLAILLLFVPGTLLGIFCSPAIIQYILYAVSGVLTFIITQQIIESGTSLAIKTQEFTPTKVIKSKTMILPMYLPNEQNIVIDTLDYFKTLRTDKRVILAYNTPVSMISVENKLNEYEIENSDWLTVVKVPNSTSKAHNLNYVLDNFELGEMVCFFDADARPCITNFDRANFWLFDQGYDYVQGRCKIRSNSPGFFDTAVSLNFALMYSVCHNFRDYVFGYALFGGSNGYWKKDAIRALKFDPEMLTEDIDCAVRALNAGYKGKYDDEIVSTEEAPPSFWSLVTQRTRWAQGWFEVTLKHFAKYFTMPVKTWSRIHIINLFIIRELLCHIKLLALPLVIAQQIKLLGLVNDQFGGAVLAYSFVPYIIQILFGVIKDKDEYWDTKWKVGSVAASLIFYTFFESFIVMRSHIRHFMGINRWVTTPRSK